MLRLFIFSLSLLSAISSNGSAIFVPSPPLTQARSYLVADQQSNTIIAAQHPHLKIEPASLTKLMTTYLTFAAIKSGQLKMDQVVFVSEHGYKAEGSRMFLELRKPVTVHELVHGMVIQSGNDASITLAEAIAGSEAVFAQMMTQKARELGMRNTHFVNATGLPHENHYTTVSDLMILAQATIRDFPEFYPLHAKKEYHYNGIKQMNRNLLLYRDPNVDGIKTGHTESAGFCSIAASKKNGRRVISIVTGEPSELARANDSASLLNYALQFFATPELFLANQRVATVDLYKASSSTLPVGFLQDIYLTLPQGQAKQITHQFVAQPTLIAPIKQGQIVGKMIILVDKKPVKSFPVVALQSVGEGSIWRRLWDSIRLWFA